MRLLEFDSHETNALAFDATGSRLLLTSSQGSVGVLDLTEDEPTPTWINVPRTRFHMACFSHDGHKLMIAGGHAGLLAYDLTTPKPQLIFEDPAYGLSCTSSPDGRVIGCTSDNTGSRLRCWIWDNLNDPLIDLGHEQGRWYANPLFLPDGLHFICVERRDVVDDTTSTRDWFALRDIDSNALLADVRIGTYVTGPLVWCVATQTMFAPQRSQLRGWKPFEPDMPTRATRLQNSKQQINGLAIHPTQPRLLAANNQMYIKVFDTQHWSVITQLSWKIGQTRGVAFSPDGLLAAAISDRGKLILWDFEE